MALKIQIIKKLTTNHLMPGGSLLLADIAFESQAALEIVKHIAGDEWEDEFYWLVVETISAFLKIGLNAKFHQISDCGGIFEIMVPV